MVVVEDLLPWIWTVWIVILYGILSWAYWTSPKQESKDSAGKKQETSTGSSTRVVETKTSKSSQSSSTTQSVTVIEKSTEVVSEKKSEKTSERKSTESSKTESSLNPLYNIDHWDNPFLDEQVVSEDKQELETISEVESSIDDLEVPLEGEPLEGEPDIPFDPVPKLQNKSSNGKGIQSSKGPSIIVETLAKPLEKVEEVKEMKEEKVEKVLEFPKTGPLRPNNVTTSEEIKQHEEGEIEKVLEFPKSGSLRPNNVTTSEEIKQHKEGKVEKVLEFPKSGPLRPGSVTTSKDTVVSTKESFVNTGSKTEPDKKVESSKEFEKTSSFKIEFPNSGPLKPPNVSKSFEESSKKLAEEKLSSSKLEFPKSGSLKPSGAPKTNEETFKKQTEESTPVVKFEFPKSGPLRPPSFLKSDQESTQVQETVVKKEWESKPKEALDVPIMTISQNATSVVTTKTTLVTKETYSPQVKPVREIEGKEASSKVEFPKSGPINFQNTPKEFQDNSVVKEAEKPNKTSNIDISNVESVKLPSIKDNTFMKGNRDKTDAQKVEFPRGGPIKSQTVSKNNQGSPGKHEPLIKNRDEDKGADPSRKTTTNRTTVVTKETIAAQIKGQSPNRASFTYPKTGSLEPPMKQEDSSDKITLITAAGRVDIPKTVQSGGLSANKVTLVSTSGRGDVTKNRSASTSSLPTNISSYSIPPGANASNKGSGWYKQYVSQTRSDGRSSPYSERSADGASDDLHRDTKSPAKLEDTLPTFQAPRRYVKPETDKRQIQSPGVIIMGAGGDMMCRVCQKRVYEMEKMIADKGIYHKMCFKCSHCKRILSLGNFASMDGNLYCKPHFIEMFKTKGLEHHYQGNYEEGFGMERHTKQWVKETASSPEAHTEASMRHLENGGAPQDITRAEDPAEEPLENLPSIRNLKSRFEAKDDGSAAAEERRPSRSSVSDYESPVNGEARISPSKWDKPKGPPPPVVNRQEEAAAEEDLPATATTRNLVAKFREIERGDVVSPTHEARPMRKMTPPREELAASITESQASMTSSYRSSEGEDADELPPPAYTKNMLAKFKSMETPGSAPSPIREQTRKATTVRTTAQFRGSQNQLSPGSEDAGVVNGGREVVEVDGGIYENQPVVNPDVIKSGERMEEDELPEIGFTKSLVAQWRNKEQEVAAKKQEEVPLTHKSHSKWETSYMAPRRLGGGGQRSTGHSESETSSPDKEARYQDQVEGGVYENQPVQHENVVREIDSHEEEFLPAPSSTKHLLEKFKTIQAEAQREGTPPVVTQKKQYKWAVKEARTLRGTTPTHDHSTNGDMQSSNEELEVNGHHAVYHEEHATLESQYNEEELPPPATTKNLLAKFKSLEDVSQPPPSPQRSAQQQKQITGVTMVRRMPGTYTQQREQPEGGEYESYPGEHHPHYYEEQTVEAGEFENAPVHDPNVIRESDFMEEGELPSQGTTRNLLAKFQNLQTS